MAGVGTRQIDVGHGLKKSSPFLSSMDFKLHSRISNYHLSNTLKISDKFGACVA